MSFGNLTIALNPVSKEAKFKGVKFGADVALITTNHPDLNGAENAAIGDREPFVISGPGEYEVREMFLRGFFSNSKYGGVTRPNTVYVFKVDDINICFAGAVSDLELSKEAEEAIDDIDILFVPIGGQGVLNPADAYKFAVRLEPKIIIPMHYGEVGEKDALKIFLKEAGADGVKPTDKLTLKKKDVLGKEGEVMTLSY
ncbi:MAG: MBL fold metallo-hydrolase [Magnetococcus sp. WYHC-3]